MFEWNGLKITGIKKSCSTNAVKNSRPFNHTTPTPALQCTMLSCTLPGIFLECNVTYGYMHICSV